MCEMNDLLSLVQIDRATMQEACINYCKKHKNCKYYQFNQEECPKIQELKTALVKEVLIG